MQIDWLTVAAQIINFLILVWLLHKFLYGPIIQAMEGREKRIASRLREAAECRAAAEREQREYRSQREALDRQREQALTRAEQEAKETRRSLEEAARREVEQRRAEWLKELDAERREFLDQLRRRGAEHMMALARRALGELGDDAQLEDQLATTFAKQVEAMDAHLRERLATACQQSGGKMVITTRHPLGAPAQRRLTRAVHKTIAEAADVLYEHDADAANGIELKVGSQTLAWTFASFLDEFEQRMSKDLSNVAPRRAEAPFA